MSVRGSINSQNTVSNPLSRLLVICVARDCGSEHSTFNILHATCAHNEIRPTLDVLVVTAHERVGLNIELQLLGKTVDRSKKRNSPEAGLMKAFTIEVKKC